MGLEPDLELESAQIVKSPKIPSLSGGVENLSAELRGFLKHTDILHECGAEEIS